MSDTPNIPTPQAEIDFIKLRKEAEEMVNRSPLYRKFIDGTPLENDIATWMVLFARDAILDHVSTLQAEVVGLRKDKERLDWLQEHPEKFFSGLMDDQDGNPTIKSFMAIPDASKARHDVREAIDLALTQPTP